MTPENTLKIADGHPLLLAGGYIPLMEAAVVVGLTSQDLLRQAAEGRLALYCRLNGEMGYRTPFGSFEPDDPMLGTVLVPNAWDRPAESKIHRAFGVYRVPADETTAVANSLLNAGTPAVVAFDEPAADLDGWAFVPDKVLKLTDQIVEVSAVEVDVLRRRMAEALAPAALEAARKTLYNANVQTVTSPKATAPLSKAVEEYCRAHLPQSISSPKEVVRIRNGLMLLAEFMGDMQIGQVSPDTLRSFRDKHLAQMPSKENQVRLKLGTTSMTESVVAIEGSDWPRMSSNERDVRMQWLYRMFRWFHAQKWISDDPCTGLRGESVLTKVERKQAAVARKDRTAFTADEIARIFAAQVYEVGSWKATKAGTFRTFQPFHYWLPLLGLFTGARIGELCQLHLEDVRCESGVWFIDINERTADKSLKNAWSERQVPLHPRLVELGFVRWCNQLRKDGFKRVFPELSWNPTNRYAKEPIRAMSQFLEKLGMPRDGTKVFHSFRHGVNNSLQKRSSMSDIMRKRMMGHEPGGGVNERHYLSDPKPAELLGFIANVGTDLPNVSAFDVTVGSIAVRDALKRKNGGKGAAEALGNASLS
ncbi:MAG: site-specific integrase [Hydrogenophaga sp.]|uniref:site-specific integrase n=1 Tax=Hydrogenophaga sp. TaxID=1904254 RepID=UPI001DB5A32A|nr:site-specific integrase [Hydrogenophaga sp.]MBW0169168.1 site-specific integrase [Hydrogenophaga sp.]MBW0183224.1 site-specific integrase [Hydrogenophaga sp.]